MQTDVSREAEVQCLIEDTLVHLSTLKFAFNNAGIEGTPFTTGHTLPVDGGMMI